MVVVHHGKIKNVQSWLWKYRKRKRETRYGHHRKLSFRIKTRRAWRPVASHGSGEADGPLKENAPRHATPPFESQSTTSSSWLATTPTPTTITIYSATGYIIELLQLLLLLLAMTTDLSIIHHDSNLPIRFVIKRRALASSMAVSSGSNVWLT